MMKSEKSGNLISRENTRPLPGVCGSLTAPLFGKVVKLWTHHGPGSDPPDAMPTGYSKHRQQTNRLGPD